MLQHQNLSSSRRLGEKWMVLSHADLVSMAKYICLVKRREIGPTAKVTEMIVPAILANSRNEEYPAWIAESNKPLSLETFFSGIRNDNEIESITKPSHSPICIGVQCDFSSLQRRPDEESSSCWIKLAAVVERLSSWLSKPSSRERKLVCHIERQRLTNGCINLVKQKQALLRPKGRTAKVKYLTTPEKGQAKPRYFWWSRQISTWCSRT